MTRDQIAQQLMLQQQQQRQMPGRPLGSPFAPPPVPQQQPLVAGTPNAPVAAPIPQYGFETGYRAAAGAPGKESDEQSKLKMLMQFMAGGG